MVGNTSSRLNDESTVDHIPNHGLAKAFSDAFVFGAFPSRGIPTVAGANDLNRADTGPSE